MCAEPNPRAPASQTKDANLLLQLIQWLLGYFKTEFRWSRYPQHFWVQVPLRKLFLERVSQPIPQNLVVEDQTLAMQANK